MLTPIFKAKINKYEIEVEEQENFKIWVGQFDGQVVDVIVRKPKTKRTNRQNSLYWVYLALIESETGNSANDIHEIAKRKFLKPIYKTVMGKEYKLPASTTKLSTKEMSEYMEQICAWCGVEIPNPENYD